jgi:ERCC4-type nuclease
MRYIKRPKLPSKLTILYDTREQAPWLFLNRCGFTMTRRNLKTGDYTLEGLEDKISIEKKSSLMELLCNLTVSSRPRFVRFLERLSKYPISCIVVCQSFNRHEVCKTIKTLQRKSNGASCLTEETVYYWIAKITGLYGIPILFLSKQELETVLPQIFKCAFSKAQKL